MILCLSIILTSYWLDCHSQPDSNNAIRQSLNCKFMEDQVNKAKAKRTKIKHHVSRQVSVRVRFCKVYQALIIKAQQL